MLCLKNHRQWIYSLLFVLSVAFISLFGLSLDSFALEDLTYTINESNASSDFYFCGDFGSVPSCSGYHYLFVSSSDVFSSFTSQIIFNYSNQTVSTFLYYFSTSSLYSFDSDFVRFRYFGSYNVPSSFSITFTLSENNPYASSPTGNIDISENGTYDVTNYATATVNVENEVIQGDYHDDLVSINNSILIVAAVGLVIYFFYAIYRMLIGGEKMRLNKCFGVLSLLFITVLLSLSGSSNTSALLHDVKYIPISSDGAFMSGGTSFTGNPPFLIGFPSDSMPQNIVYDKVHYFTSRVDNNRCTFVNGTDSARTLPGYLEVGNSLSYSFPSYRFNYVSNSNIPYCQQLVPFGTLYPNESNILSHPNFDDSSLVNIPLAQRSAYLGLTPYYYDYDSFYVHDSATDSSTGFTYNNTLKISEIVGSKVSRIHILRIPLGRLNESVVGAVTEGRHIKYQGVFDFSGQDNYVNLSQSFVDSGSITLYYSGLRQSDSYEGTLTNYAGSTSCSLNHVTLPSTGFNQLEFTCEFDSPVTFYNGQLWFWFYMSGTGYIFDTNADWSFSSAYFMTDNDDTPGGTWGTEPTGNNLSHAPGSAEGLIPPEEDFFNKLVNLFAFNVTNPFAGLLDMIHDPNSCADISTISGMIHAEETTYCPWFPTSVRNIVTPVLSIAGVMVVFGFFVRWLGARSGNLFEDALPDEGSARTKGITTDNYHFSNKYRRRK